MTVRLLPKAVQHSSIWMQSYHAVLDCHPVDEGLFVIDEVGVWHPQLICHPVVQGQVEWDPSVRETFVPPRLLEVHGDGVVLKGGRAGVRKAVA